MTTDTAFIQSLTDILERRRVSRDNPVHQRLVAGDFTPAMLQEWGRQQWLYLRAYPGFLCLLAGNAPDPALREMVLTMAYSQEFGPASGVLPRWKRWATLCAAFGLSTADLEAAKPLPTTEAMLSTQELVARRSFAEGVVGLLIGSTGEASSFLAVRRAALVEQYHIPDSALAYFDPQVQSAAAPELMELVARTATTADQQEAARQALQRILNVRWEFFSGLGRAFGEY